MKNRDRASAWWAALLLLAITAAGFWFRWLYVRDVSFFVDEYLTVRAAQRILDVGLPLLPSGNFYSHGLLLSYIVAAIVGLGGREPWLIRLPVLLLSTATIPLTYWFGRRLFGAATPDAGSRAPTNNGAEQGGAGPHVAGLLAAALLAFAPEAILWGGRVRMYGILPFTILLATYVFYAWVVREQDRPLFPFLFVLCFWSSMFLHAEAMLLLPLWGLWALVQRGWRWCLRPTNLGAFALSGLAVAIEIALRRMGAPVQAWVSPGVLQPLTRQYLGAAWDWSGVQKVIEPLFLTAQRLPCTLLALAGLGYLLWSCRADWQSALRRLRPRPLSSGDGPAFSGDGPASTPWQPRRCRPLAYLYALLLPVLALLLFVVDRSWKSPRYGLMLLPHFFLIAGGVVAGGGRLLSRRLAWRPRASWTWLVALAAVLMVAAGSWPAALAATRESVPSYDWAFAYVDDHWQPGDVVITFLCPAAFLHLGRCDYLAIPADFEGFAIQRDGRWVSGWDEVPLLDSADGLRQVLASAPRAWFVVDEGRFAQRYPAEFLQAVWDGMELVASEREMLVFRSLDPAVVAAEKGSTQERPVDFQDGVSLLGSAGVPEDWAAGGAVSLVLYWQARSWIEGEYTVFVHLLDNRGVLRSQADAPPLGGLYPTRRWPPGLVLPDRHVLRLAGDLEPDRYRLEVGLYDPASSDRLPLLGAARGSAVLDYVWIGDRSPLGLPPHRTATAFGGAIRLLGYELSPEQPTSLLPGGTLTVTLYWQAITELDRDFTVFAHLVDGTGQIQAQGDGPPLDGDYPTSFWEPGEVLADAHSLTLPPEIPAGDYRLLVGFYTLADGLRLPVTAGAAVEGDRAVLTSLAVR